MSDNMIIKPVTRRRFFMFLGAAVASPIIHHIIPKKLIFDMSGPVIATVPWRHYFKLTSIPITDLTGDHLNLLLAAQADMAKLYTKLQWSAQVNPTSWGTVDQLAKVIS